MTATYATFRLEFIPLRLETEISKRSERRHRCPSTLAAILTIVPFACFGAPIYGVHIINSAETIGSGELLQIRTRTSPLEVANLIVGWGSGNTGGLTVSGSDQVEIDGTPDTIAAGVFPGMPIARQSGSAGLVRVNGAGAKLTLKGNRGFLNVAASGTSNNDTGSLEVTSGAVVSGADGANDFVLLNVGGGATTSGSGHGVVTIASGSSLLLDSTGVPLTALGPWINVGRNSGATGQLIVSGAGSQVVMTSDNISPSVVIGRGRAGTLAISNGALLQMNGYGLSAPSEFNNNQLRIGGDVGASVGTGTVAVSGSGSRTHRA